MVLKISFNIGVLHSTFELFKSFEDSYTNFFEECFDLFFDIGLEWFFDFCLELFLLNFFSLFTYISCLINPLFCFLLLLTHFS